MRRILIFFVKLAIIVAIAVWLAERPGTVTLKWLNWELHSTVGVLIVVVVVGATIVALFIASGAWFCARRGTICIAVRHDGESAAIKR